MPTIHITITPESRFVRAASISALVVAAVVWRMWSQGDSLLSTRVGLACGFVVIASLGVWAVQRLTDQRWSWFTVFLAVCVASIAVVWSTVFVLRAT
jgi:hypothetical protein